MRTRIGLWALAELAAFVAVATQIGVGWTILATLATSALGLSLAGRQVPRVLAELRERAGDPAARRSAGRALGDAGLVVIGGLLMILPGFLGDLAGLLCLVPGTRAVPRAVAERVLAGHVARATGPVRVRSTRVAGVGRGADGQPGGGEPPVIEGEVLGPSRTHKA